MKKTSWKKYAFEFLSIFIAVISAFALSNWNDNRNSRLSEEKILREINNGISIDIQDFDGNMGGHQLSLRANAVFRDLINNKTVTQDSIQLFYIALFRDYTPIINRSGYESLKASGMKTIKNDSLRFKIIALYDYYYNLIEKVEDGIDEMKTFPNYFSLINDRLHAHMIFDQRGNFLRFDLPMNLTEQTKKELLSYLWRLEINRRFKLSRYETVKQAIQNVKKSIEEELD